MDIPGCGFADRRWMRMSLRRVAGSDLTNYPAIRFVHRVDDMIGFVLRVASVALGLWLAAEIIPGIAFDDGWTLLAAALVLGIVNAVIRPVIVILTLPISILTLGFFLLVINAAMLGLVAWLLDGFQVAGFWSALFGALMVRLVSWMASWFIGPKGRVEMMVVERRY
jgi:putative membrane protein